jgi:hypothetical protein
MTETDLTQKLENYLTPHSEKITYDELDRYYENWEDKPIIRFIEKATKLIALGGLVLSAVALKNEAYLLVAEGLMVSGMSGLVRLTSAQIKYHTHPKNKSLVKRVKSGERISWWQVYKTDGQRNTLEMLDTNM